MREQVRLGIREGPHDLADLIAGALVLLHFLVVDEQLPGNDLADDTGSQSTGSDVEQHVEAEFQLAESVDFVVSRDVIESSSATEETSEGQSNWIHLCHIFFPL